MSRASTDPVACIAILVNYCGAGDSVACIESLMAAGRVPRAIVLIDNASPRDGLDAVAAGLDRAGLAHCRTDDPLSHAPEILLLAHGHNAGFGAACNRARDVAVERYGSLDLWFINNDSHVDADCLHHLVETAQQHGGPCLVGATVMDDRDEPRVQCLGGGTVNRWLAVERPLRSMPAGARVARLDFIHGCCLYMTAPAAEKLPGFDEVFFLYWEEVDLCLKAKALGIALCWAPQASLRHAQGASTGRSNALTDYHHTVGAVIIADRYDRPRSLVSTRLLLLAKIANRVRRGQTARLPTLLRGFRDGRRLARAQAASAAAAKAS